MDQPMNNPTPKPMMGASPSGPFATALVWATPWLVMLTIYLTPYTWKPELSMFGEAKPMFIVLLGIALFAVTFLAVFSLNRKSSRPTGGMPSMPPKV